MPETRESLRRVQLPGVGRGSACSRSIRLSEPSESAAGAYASVGGRDVSMAVEWRQRRVASHAMARCGGGRWLAVGGRWKTVCGKESVCMCAWRATCVELCLEGLLGVWCGVVWLCAVVCAVRCSVVLVVVLCCAFKRLASRGYPRSFGKTRATTAFLSRAPRTSQLRRQPRF